MLVVGDHLKEQYQHNLSLNTVSQNNLFAEGIYTRKKNLLIRLLTQIVTYRGGGIN